MAKSGIPRKGGKREEEFARLELARQAEMAYDDLTRLAADIGQTPIAVIAVEDAEHEWFRSSLGVDLTELLREFTGSEQAHAHPHDAMIVEDTLLDPRFSRSPHVIGEEGIRFYCGTPLVTADGRVVGTLCLIDRVPRTVDAGQLERLRFLAGQVVATMEQRQVKVATRWGELT